VSQDAAASRPISPLTATLYRQITVNPLRWLIHAFVNTFGITPPTPEEEARSSRIVALMLVAVAVVLVVAAYLLRSAFTR
jgi:hypothetical protein